MQWKNAFILSANVKKAPVTNVLFSNGNSDDSIAVANGLYCMKDAFKPWGSKIRQTARTLRHNVRIEDEAIWKELGDSFEPRAEASKYFSTLIALKRGIQETFKKTSF